MAAPETTAAPDAITLLTTDHRNVDALFKRFEKEKDTAAKAQLATQICNELTVHATAEEEIFYPQAMAVLGEDDQDLMWEATVEHGTLEGLIARIEGLDAEDESFDAHVKVLEEYVKHHVKEEEGEMFPKVRRTSLDMQALGEQIFVRKEMLKGQLEKDSGKGSRKRRG